MVSLSGDFYTTVFWVVSRIRGIDGHRRVVVDGRAGQRQRNRTPERNEFALPRRYCIAHKTYRQPAHSE